MNPQADSKSRHVLILDGDRMFTDAFGEALTNRGYRVSVAPPAEFFSALGDLKSGVAICDVEAPGAVGANIPAQILAARPDLTCVAMARRPNLRQAVNPASDDALAYIDKTKSLESAVVVVERCFEKREARQLVAKAAEPLSEKQAIEAANHAKLEFLAKISHELRTPLNAIIGFSELIIRDARTKFGNEQHRTYVADIHSSGRHLLDIINDILDFAKAEAGKLVLQESEVDVREVANAIRRIVGAKARESGIDLVEILPDDFPHLWCDERKLKQMLLNLLTNAVKFTPSGGRISLEGEVLPNGVGIYVRDSGIGIAEADLPRVLQPFIQVDSTWTRQQEGTGLGLPLVKAMIELHGGQIAIESEVAKGTTVKLILPKERVLAPRTDEFVPEPRARQG